MRFTCLPLILSLAFLVPGHTSAEEADPWNEEPGLSSLRTIARGSMAHYAAWSEAFQEAGREPIYEDWTVNALVEEMFVHLMGELAKHPDPDFLKECLFFLGEQVPYEVDSLWRLVFLEMSVNLDRTVGQEVDAILREKGRLSLLDRAMAPSDDGARPLVFTSTSELSGPRWIPFASTPLLLAAAAFAGQGYRRRREAWLVLLAASCALFAVSDLPFAVANFPGASTSYLAYRITIPLMSVSEWARLAGAILLAVSLAMGARRAAKPVEGS